MNLAILKKVLLAIISIHCFCVNINAQKNNYSNQNSITLEYFKDFDTSQLKTYYEIKYHQIFNDAKFKNIAIDTIRNKIKINLYIAVPIFVFFNFTKEDTLMMFQNEDYSYRGVLGLDKYKYDIYLGIVYDTIINNKLNSYEKNSLKESFINNSLSDFKSRDLDDFSYLKRIDSSVTYDRYKNAIPLSNEPIILIPFNKSFVNKNKIKKK